MLSKHKILLASPSSESKDSLMASLKSKNANIEDVQTGKDAQLALYQGQWSIFILDFEIQNHSALEVLNYVRGKYPQLKIYGLVPDPQFLSLIGHNIEKPQELGVEKFFLYPKDNEMLVDALTGLPAEQKWRQLKDSGKVSEEEELQRSDDDFTSINIDQFMSGRVTIFDLYVRLASGRYLKILTKGDSFDQSRIDTYVKKGLGLLYFLKADRPTYINFANTMASQLMPNENIPTKAKYDQQQIVSEKFIEQVHVDGINPVLLKEATTLCNNICLQMQEHKGLKETFDLLLKSVSHTTMTHTFFNHYVLGHLGQKPQLGGR